MARDPDDHDVAYAILADHIVITESLHPEATTSLAAAIRAAVEEWLEDNTEEYRHQGGA